MRASYSTTTSAMAPFHRLSPDQKAFQPVPKLGSAREQVSEDLFLLLVLPWQ